jgi:hypothetical protein
MKPKLVTAITWGPARGHVPPPREPELLRPGQRPRANQAIDHQRRPRLTALARLGVEPLLPGPAKLEVLARGVVERLGAKLERLVLAFLKAGVCPRSSSCAPTAARLRVAGYWNLPPTCESEIRFHTAPGCHVAAILRRHARSLGGRTGNWFRRKPSWSLQDREMDADFGLRR